MIGRAIALIVRTEAEAQQQKRDRKSQGELKALQRAAQQDWEAINRERFQNTPPAALAETQLAEQYFATAAQDFEKLRALASWEEWRPVLAALRAKAWRRQTMDGVVCPMTRLAPADYDRLAQKLHERFPKTIREGLKADWQRQSSLCQPDF